MKGIYKITSPSGRSYIGQSIDIKRRWEGYRKDGCQDQIRLQRSFNKYAVDQHYLEIKEECENLNERERFYQEEFNTVESGLNLRYTKTDDKSGTLSKETCKRMSKSKLGELNHMFGQTHSEETKEKIRKKRTGWKAPQELRDKLSKQRKGKPKLDSHKKALAYAMSSNPKNIFNHTVICPHCGKEGQKPNMKRWHFDKCKRK